jgi:hypothetical protein
VIHVNLLRIVLPVVVAVVAWLAVLASLFDLDPWQFLDVVEKCFGKLIINNGNGTAALFCEVLK